MINLFEDSNDYLPEIAEEKLSDAEVITEIKQLKSELKDKVIVLGHHYQQDEIIQFADFKGDSLALAKAAAKLKHEYIIFCGVHFMAETADMLSSAKQKVILPDLNAGCTMADMAKTDDVKVAFKRIEQVSQAKIVPITYINCTAELKAFVGSKGGSICTSSNAKKMITWALDQGEKLFFFPDQHLGRNTCYDLGIPLKDMVVYNPNLPNGGISDSEIKAAKVILWYGLCSVHQGFTKQQVADVKNISKDIQVIVHPECSFDVVQAADDSGSTAYIVDQIKTAPAGSQFAIGTEINLVNRLASEYPMHTIKSLSPYQCLCTTMYRIRPRWLLASFRSIQQNCPHNIISVPKEIKDPAMDALNLMLNL